MASFTQINSFNSIFYTSSNNINNNFQNSIVCDSIDNSLVGYNQYMYTTVNRNGFFYLNTNVDKTIYILAIGGGGSGGTPRGGGGGLVVL